MLQAEARDETVRPLSGSQDTQRSFFGYFAYIKIPKNVKGNPGPNSRLGEMMFEKGFHYVFDKQKMITHNLSDEITISHNQILNEHSKMRKFKLRLCVNTSKYGTVKSNICKIKNYK
jgi:hypothetical protein